MSKIYILIEQAIGYGLLKAKKCNSTDDLLEKLKERNFEKLISNLELIEFQPFTSAANAALNCVDIANGVVSEDLSKLLKSHLSDVKAILVVNDKKLLESLKAAKINSELAFTADNSLIFNMREIRHNFHLIINDSKDHLVKAHIGLGHGYSRIKIKYNVNRSDNMIIQTINLLDQMDKDINTMAMRLREWFGYHYPELFKIVPDYKMYAKVVQLIKSRSGAKVENLEALETILQDSAKAQAIIDASKTSMGFELTEEDFLNIIVFADKILAMIDQREYTLKYLGTKMNQVAPNFSTLVGDIVAARLISHAGSLINLAKFPASTIQILGAEKALFRAIKTRGNTPKYGLIFHSSFIGKAAKGDKGRISRFLAAKISLAVRLDCFMDEPINIYGQHLKKHVEDQLVYLETGKEPQKNYEMMEAAVKDAKEFMAKMKLDAIKNPKKTGIEDVMVKNEKKIPEQVISVKEISSDIKSEKKKTKKKGAMEGRTSEVKVEPVDDKGEKKLKKSNNINSEVKTEVKDEPIVSEKKKKRTVEQMTTGSAIPTVTEVKEESADISEKKKKKRKSEQMTTETIVPTVIDIKEESVNVSGKKKKKRQSEQMITETTVAEVKEESVSEKKKKKTKSEDVLNNVTEPVVANSSSAPKKEKKNKKTKSEDVLNNVTEPVVANSSAPKKEKKNKKNKM